MSAEAIHRQDLEIGTPTHIPGRPVHFDWHPQSEAPCVWFEHSPGWETEVRTFMTGEPIGPTSPYPHHVGTIISGFGIVIHLRATDIYRPVDIADGCSIGNEEATNDD